MGSHGTHYASDIKAEHIVFDRESNIEHSVDDQNHANDEEQRRVNASKAKITAAAARAQDWKRMTRHSQLMEACAIRTRSTLDGSNRLCTGTTGTPDMSAHGRRCMQCHANTDVHVQDAISAPAGIVLQEIELVNDLLGAIQRCKPKPRPRLSEGSVLHRSLLCWSPVAL